MDRTELSSAIRQEMQGVVGEALATVAPEVVTADLATLEQRVQQGGRVILGGLMERVAARQAQGLPRPARGPACPGALKRRERPRSLGGLVEARLTQAGLRWGVPGRQAMASLRAVQRSGRGAAFGQTRPAQYRPPTEEAAPPTPCVTTAAAPRPAVSTAPPVPLSARSSRVAALAAAPRATPRPKPTPAHRPLLLPRSA